MTAIIQQDQSSHWYAQDGAPRYEATLREARKEQLLPSPTSILGLIKSEGLETWKQEQLLLSTLTLPRLMCETDDEFAKRAIQDAKQTTKAAAELGTRIHHGVESILAGRNFDHDLPQLEVFKDWAATHVTGYDWLERVQVNLDLGVAGRADGLVTLKDHGPVLVDWKSQMVKQNKRGVYTPRFYEKWPMQLAFYAYCEMVPPTIASVVINTNAASEPWIKVWTDEERDAAWDAFQHTAALWFHLKKYKPRKKDGNEGGEKKG